MRRTYLVLFTVLGLALFISACGGGDSKTEATQVATVVPRVSATASVSSTTVTTVASPTVAPTQTPVAGLPKEQQDRLIKKIDQAIALLTPLAQPGGFTAVLDRAKYKGSDWDIKQIELNGRLALEALLGKDPSLNEFRGRPGSNPPPDEGYLKALKAAILSGQLKNVGGTGPTDPLKVKGAERLLTDVLNGLAFFDPTGGYEKEIPTPATKTKFGPNQALGADGVVNVAGVKEAYFLLVEVYYEVQPILVSTVRLP